MTCGPDSPDPLIGAPLEHGCAIAGPAARGFDFQRYDALLLPVTSIPAHAHGLTQFTIDGMPIAAQLAANWHAELTILHIASLLASLSPVRNQHSAL